MVFKPIDWNKILQFDALYLFMGNFQWKLCKSLTIIWHLLAYLFVLNVPLTLTMCCDILKIKFLCKVI